MSSKPPAVVYDGVIQADTNSHSRTLNSKEVSQEARYEDNGLITSTPTNTNANNETGPGTLVSAEDRLVLDSASMINEDDLDPRLIGEDQFTSDATLQTEMCYHLRLTESSTRSFIIGEPRIANPTICSPSLPDVPPPTAARVPVHGLVNGLSQVRPTQTSLPVISRGPEVGIEHSLDAPTKGDSSNIGSRTRTTFLKSIKRKIRLGSSSDQISPYKQARFSLANLKFLRRKRGIVEAQDVLEQEKGQDGSSKTQDSDILVAAVVGAQDCQKLPVMDPRGFRRDSPK